jgi:hypothetical protein
MKSRCPFGLVGWLFAGTRKELLVLLQHHPSLGGARFQNCGTVTVRKMTFSFFSRSQVVCEKRGHAHITPNRGSPKRKKKAIGKLISEKQKQKVHLSSNDEWPMAWKFTLVMDRLAPKGHAHRCIVLLVCQKLKRPTTVPTLTRDNQECGTFSSGSKATRLKHALFPWMPFTSLLSAAQIALNNGRHSHCCLRIKGVVPTWYRPSIVTRATEIPCRTF